MIGDGDMRHVGPGLYLDERNNLHLDIAELLEHSGYADTPENRDTLSKAALAVFRQLYPGVPTHVV